MRYIQKGSLCETDSPDTGEVARSARGGALSAKLTEGERNKSAAAKFQALSPTACGGAPSQGEPFALFMQLLYQKPGGFYRLPGTQQTMLYSYTLNIDKAQARRMCPAIRICLGAKHSTTHADGGDGMDGIHGTFLLSSLFVLPVRIHWLYHTPIYLLCQYVSR